MSNASTLGSMSPELQSGNFRSLLLLVEETRKAWYKWLCRRSQRGRLTRQRYAALLERFPLPRPRITVRIWGGV